MGHRLRSDAPVFDPCGGVAVLPRRLTSVVARAVAVFNPITGFAHVAIACFTTNAVPCRSCGRSHEFIRAGRFLVFQAMSVGRRSARGPTPSIQR
jgi:hypothetical protein